MGAPTSANLMETFMQYLEHTLIVNILKKYEIIDYYRYVDDILIIYNAQTTNINNTLDKFNIIHPKIMITTEEEQDNKINYLDITTVKTHNRLQPGIYRKPTTMDHIIHNNSCHPYEYKKQ
jgi:nucleoside-specific outer membrane channel protein Tsx